MAKAGTLAAQAVAGMACVAVAFFGSAAHAEPDTGSAFSSPAPDRWLLFAGTDVSRHALSAWKGAELAAPAGFDATGWRLRLYYGAGIYRTPLSFDASVTNVVVKGFGFVGPGYSVVTPLWRLSVFAGIEVDFRETYWRDPDTPHRGSNLGARIAADLWAEPASWLRIAGSAGYGTARGAWDARLLIGVPLWDRVIVGPELAAMGDRDGGESRLGLAAAGLALGPFEAKLAGGFARKDDGHGAGYGTVAVWRKF